MQPWSVLCMRSQTVLKFGSAAFLEHAVVQFGLFMAQRIKLHISLCTNALLKGKKVKIYTQEECILYY